jgi:hypothetical protein
MSLENCVLDAEQIAAFIARHRASLIEFRFEDVTLRNGDWAGTLEPLRVLKRLERSRQRAERQQEEALRRAASESTLCEGQDAEEMDVPVMFLKEVGGKGVMFDEEPVIMETLEPQEVPGQWAVGGIGKSFGMKKWFGVGKAKGNGQGVKHERKVSDHLKRVLHGGIFPWR